MRLRTRFVFVPSLCVLLVASSARASTIVVDGGPPDQQNIYFADINYSWIEATHNTGPFTLFSDATITGADWWGGCVAGADGDPSAADAGGTPTTCIVPSFTMTFYSGTADGGLAPGAVFTSVPLVPTTQELTGLNINGTVPEYHYFADLGSLFLPAGNYLLGLSADLTATLAGNQPNDPPIPISWGWETTPSGEAQHFQFYAPNIGNPVSGPWLQNPQALAFDLIGPDVTPPTPVPEPATLSLVAIGIAGAALRRRRAGTTR
jgi:hypothetical protein